MDPEIQAQIDKLVSDAKSQAQADAAAELEVQKAQIQKEAQLAVIAAIKSQMGIQS